MSNNNLDRFKYGILKALDVSGFKVFDPVIRLIFREEPEKQTKLIMKFIVLPVLFIIFCFLMWSVIAPHHKTKSGEVPTPDAIWNAAKINHSFDYREDTKSSDFLLTGSTREEKISDVNLQIEQLTERYTAASAKVSELDAKYKNEILPQKLSKVDASYKELRNNVKNLKKRRAAEAKIILEDVVAGKAEKKEYLAKIEENKTLNSKDSDALKALKTQMNEIRSEKYKPLEDARKESNSIADELQFLKKRVEFLTKSNRSVKVDKAKGELNEYFETMNTSDSEKAISASAKKIVSKKASIERLEEQQYAAAVTVYQQIKRSLFTVLCGFLMAAVVAIPIGIMCGLNPVFMACLMPIISIFKPVSPVVWLLIFQIVVGAFFPDPETHPFFLLVNSLPLIGDLKINPALIFSACTVATCAVWPALINTALGVASVDNDHINVARVLKLGFKDRLFKIIIPTALPFVFAGLRISLGVGWMVLIAAEALSSSDGLGKFVWDEYQNGSSHSFANIIYACFVIGIIGFFLDRMMIVLQRLVSFDDNAATV